MDKVKALILSATLTVTVSASAIVANPAPFVVTQPDGTTVTLHRVGDETQHFTLTDDNKIVVCDADGQYSYARLDADKNLVSTGIRALDRRVRPATHANFTIGIEAVDVDAMLARRRADGKIRSLNARGTLRTAAGPKSHAQASGDIPAQVGMGLFPNSSYPVKGNVNGLIILVEYKDTKFSSDIYKQSAKQYFTDMVLKKDFSEYGATGSVTDYFSEMSGGQFSPKFDVVGPVSLPNNMSFYGGNDSNGNDKAPEMMVVHAASILDSEVDFSKYDNDGDGYVDNIFVFYAGRGEASGGSENSVWPHSWDISHLKLSVDGVILGSYACACELLGPRTPDGIGTFVHEFSHVMGLPDLYATSYTNSVTPGEYSVMDVGSYNNNSRTPPAYGAYERNAMGWTVPRLLSEPDYITLDHILNSNECCLIQTGNDNEFFLLENRQKAGWDTYLPNHGMLIWRVEYNKNVFAQNIVNNTPTHQYIEIIKAGGGKTNTKAWVWPGPENKTAFTATTTPAMTTWRGEAVDCPITDIVDDGGIIGFSVCGGSPFPTPELNPTTHVGTDCFTASWQPVEGAVDYLVSVYKHTGRKTISDVSASFGAKSTTDKLVLPEGWTSTSDATYIGSGMYGNEMPSLKLANDGEMLMTQLFDAPIGKLSFWYRGNVGRVSGSTLVVEGLVPADGDALSARTNTSDVSGEWISLCEPLDLYANNKVGQTVEVADIPENVRAVRFVLNKVTNSSNCALDDVVLSGYGEKIEVVPGYDGYNTGGLTQIEVKGLDTDALFYHYTVCATDGETVSRPTAQTDVYLQSGAVSNISAETAEDVIAASGRTLTVATTARWLTVFDAVGRVVVSARVSDGIATVTLPDAGLYIVRAADTRKVVVR